MSWPPRRAPMSPQTSNPQPPPPGINVHWLNVLFYIYLHLAAAYGVGLIFTEAAICTTLIALLLALVVPLSTTLVHRLFAHRAFEAATPLKVLIVAIHTFVGQGSVYDWVKEHRFHHQVRGTALDPYDASRGFWFAHLNNKMVKRRPDQEAAKEAVDMSDLEADSVVMWQKRLYWFVMPVFAFLLPINAPCEYWDESLITSLCIVGAIRHIIVLHYAWLVTSGPLLYGLKHDQNEADSNQVFFIRRSRWPDYHYLFPWDYKTSEYGSYGDDWTTWLIQQYAALGWAYDLKTCSTETMKKALEVSLDEKLPIEKSVLKVMESKKAQNGKHEEQISN
ncbi:acyl-CoA Delta-9 desaturase [Neocloeon triangulifer]|uniref:acyl-CoA Delta-9 desaturase n=1 Tax=Neocloeon triangulifer TaxID=2078957 RepID=UPI00286EFB20|nr:acyl-CoA Delta-9 desaturase [Neocloeon triangulifer]